MANTEKLFLFFLSTREKVIESEVASHGEQDAKSLLVSFAEGMLGLPHRSLNNDDTVVVLPDEWQTGEIKHDNDQARFYEDARWYLHQTHRGMTARPYNGSKLVYINAPAALMMVPVFVSSAPVGTAAADGGSARLKQKEVAFNGNTKKPLGSADDGSLQWESVYIFISSTFNDMHAERDYLVKKVFPELSAWCEERKLRLVDIDLRWGVTEADSEQNKRTVEVCLKNIDRCRPFFLCFLGQRRGWVPARSDISDATLELFPKLRDNLGHSVTELEIMHALIDPMRSGHIENGEDPAHAFFYLRTPEYLKDIKSDALRRIYTNEGAPDAASAEAELRRFREEVIPGTARPCHEYSALWDEDLETPELSFALERNPEITRGRLRDFKCGGDPLAESVIGELKRAITLRFGERKATAGQTPLHKELEDQARFLQTAGEAFIEREHDSDELNAYIESDDARPLLLTAEAGMGKTSLLAHFVQMCGYRVTYRFIGKSDEADLSEKLAFSILSELSSEGRIKSRVPRDPDELQRAFPSLMAEAVSGEGLILVIDALDQLSGGANSAAFMLRDLPAGLKLIVSVKTEGSEDFIAQAANDATVIKARPFDSEDDRKRLVNAYLGNYLKQLDDDVLETLIYSQGAENPLFLKVVLSELRIFGSHGDLKKVIGQSFGTTPVSAFGAMLARLERDPAYCQVPMALLTENVFGWLSHTQSGLSVSELAELLVRYGTALDIAAARDAVNMLFRQLRAYLAMKDGRTDFFFESFRKACAARYERKKTAEKWHGELAGYFAGKPVSDQRRLYEQAYQYARAGMTEAYMDFVFGAEYVDNKLKYFGAEALVQDCSYYVCDSTRLIAGFYRLCSSVLLTNPGQLANRLFGHLSGADDEYCQRLLDDTARRKKEAGEAWLRPKVACFDLPGSGSVREFRADFKLGASVKLISGDTRMVIRSGAHQVAVWDIEKGKIVTRIGTDDLFVRAIESAPDGRRFTAILDKSGEEGSLLRVWDAATFRVRYDIPIKTYWLETKQYGVPCATENCFAFTIDSRIILIKNSFGEIKLFDVETGQSLKTADYRGEISAYGIGRGGLVVVGNLHPQRNDDRWELSWFKRELNPLGLFDYDPVTRTLEKRGVEPAGHKNTVTCTAASPDGTMAASADADGCVCLWNAVSGESLAEFPGDNRDTVFLQFMDSGASLLAVGSGGDVTVYDTNNFSVIKKWKGFGVVTGADLFGDESHCVLRTGVDSIRLVDLHSGATPRNTAGEAIRSIGIMQERGLVVASSYKNFIERDMEPVAISTVSGVLHFFDTDTNAYIRSAHLHGCDNFDFVYTDQSGRFAVSKANMTPNTPAVKYWALDDDLLMDGEDPAAELFQIAEVRRGKDMVFPNNFRFSSDLRYICGCDEDGGAVYLYKSSTGRFMGRVFLKNAKKMEKNMMYTREFEVSPDGAILYVLYPESGLLEAYRVAWMKRLFSKKLIGFLPDVYSSDNMFNNDGLVLSKDGKQLLFISKSMTALIDITAGRVESLLDRQEHKPGERCRDLDTFVSMSGNARFLALSRMLYGEGIPEDETDSDNHRNRTRTDRFEVWDMRKNKKIAEFYTDGTISNIIADDAGRTYTFGLQSGRICTLVLENYI